MAAFWTFSAFHIREFKQPRFLATHVNRKWTFSALEPWLFEQIFGQIVPIRVKTLSNTNLLASRHIALQCWNSVVTIRNNVATMLQRCLALRIVPCNITFRFIHHSRHFERAREYGVLNCIMWLLWERFDFGPSFKYFPIKANKKKSWSPKTNPVLHEIGVACLAGVKRERGNVGAPSLRASCAFARPKVSFPSLF